MPSSRFFVQECVNTNDKNTYIHIIAKSLDLLQVDLQGDAREKNERERASASDEVASAREVDLSNLQDFHLHFAPKLSNKVSY